ncbi:hypothetical protein EDD36DRAFT_480690 [Exophiala viscosa]|uniref:Uncharacterized protein n=1 Tax=Exophiala viscosa TaxID=2486360 RepID=A0AAN6E603_9EURO|nr:hypothetical protein EDD36DRAFT_480690 [Exophiala viscosa]
MATNNGSDPGQLQELATTPVRSGVVHSADSVVREGALYALLNKSGPPESAVNLIYELIEVCMKEGSPEAHNVKLQIRDELEALLRDKWDNSLIVSFMRSRGARSRVKTRISKERLKLKVKALAGELSKKAGELSKKASQLESTLNAYCIDQEDPSNGGDRTASHTREGIARKRKREDDLDKEFQELEDLKLEWKKLRTELDTGHLLENP